MLGFIAEYTGKAVGYIVETAEDVWQETTSMADRFSEGYNSVVTPHAPKKTEQNLDYKVASNTEAIETKTIGD